MIASYLSGGARQHMLQTLLLLCGRVQADRAKRARTLGWYCMYCFLVHLILYSHALCTEGAHQAAVRLDHAFFFVIHTAKHSCGHGM